MKKKTLLTLGVCALAMGAVVGAVSAHEAARVKADDTFTLSLTLTVTNFDGATMQKPQLVYKAAGATKESFYNNFVADGNDPTKFTGVIAGIASGTFTCHVATWGDASPWPEYDFYGDSTGADYSFELTGNGTLKMSGDLVAKAEKGVGSFEYKAEEITIPDPDHPNGWYLVGGMNGWAANDDWYTDGYDENNVAKWLGVTLSKNVTFAFVYSNYDNLEWSTAKRYAAKGGGGAGDIFVNAEDGDQNFKCTTAGTYDIYMTNDYKLYFEVHNEPETSETSAASSEAVSEETSEATSVAPTFADGWYMVGSMNEWKQNAAYYTDGYEEEKNVAMWLEVTLAKDDTFAFAYSNADKLDWDQAKRFADRGTTGGAREVFVDAEDGDHNFKCTVAGTYDIYMGLDYKLYFEAHGGETSSDSSAATSEATSETPVLGGYVYISTAHGATSTTLYTWEGEGGEGHQNAPWPGVEINTVEGVAVTFGTNFNGQGGLWRVPVTSLMEKFIITIQASENEVNKEYKTGDLVAAAGVYVAPGAEATDAAIGAQAELCFDIEAAIGATTNHSVCEIGKEQAAALVARYDALEKTEVLDEATYWTYDVEYKDLTPETKPAKNFTYAELLIELRSTAESTNHSVWNVTSVANNTMFVVTLLVVGGGLVGAVALYFISKKRRLQK